MNDTSGVCDALRAALGEIPLFPLGSTVFFPHTLLPLHIFEPRYRQMTEHALAHHRVIAVVQCDREENVAEVCGVGRIVHHEKLEGGRFHILLQGLARLHIEEELPRGDLPFRRARTRVIDPIIDDAAVRELNALRSCYDQLSLASPAAARDTLGDLVQRIQDPSVLADVACATALCDPRGRQAALCEPRVSVRLRMATEALADVLLAHAPEADVFH